MTALLFVDILLLMLTLLALWYGVRLHQLLRAGELGRAWQFIVFGVILLTLRELLRLSNQLLSVPSAPFLERVVEAGFMVLLCYALWRQWSAFDFLRGRTRKKPQWQRVAQSFAAANEQQPTETLAPSSAESASEQNPSQEAAEKEWREQWYRKA